MLKIKFYTILFFFFINLFLLPLKADPIFDLGKNVYLNIAMCGGCHALADAGSVGSMGPNLDQISLDKASILTAIKYGNGIMPAFEEDLSKEEIEAVVHYVYTASNN